MPIFPRPVRKALHRLKLALAPAAEALVAGYVRFSIWWLRLWPLWLSAGGMAFWARLLGPFFAVSKVARRNLSAAFPEKSPSEINALVRGIWANMGRLSAEFAQQDRLWDYDPQSPDAGRVEVKGADIMARLREDGRPALFFTAHTGNWEMCAIAGAKLNVPGGVLYRAPNNKRAAAMIEEMRSGTMPGLVRAGRDAGRVMARMLADGQHLGMLVDQYWTGGPEVVFFGRPCATNPTLARLARQFDCPVHGMRVVRLPGARFRVEVTEEVALPRDADGKIEVVGAMQAVTSVIEGWVREYPDQWLWLHRRWR
ncbi:lipid A biosynthesis lauroyl acyltransferase [Xanthobacter dioxanivorans]|uniref:Lipid A biosynthesis lauroyl acyltransferase n=1 Tax=Xanthobacter dioxanivorans TaxID=2528964 RepID=A0A974SGJ3_9HYPH|nr:lipid A biosynthesis lauroyl acyltransferase [Xanthobacter dioxanivorans]QRG04765.1 lipid A biosynthesis lauroyl acyltransferase [Xanthobacter dioxanivorans]